MFVFTIKDIIGLTLFTIWFGVLVVMLVSHW